MYPLRSLNVPLGVHVPQFGNPCTKGTNEALLQRFLIILFFCFSAKVQSFKKNKNLKGKFTSLQIDIAVKDVLNGGMGIREAGRMHNIHNVTLRRYVLKAKQQNLDQIKVHKLSMVKKKIR